MPDTAVLPRTGYTLRRDRCVIELSLRVLGIPLLRRRLTATDGHWTPGAALAVTLRSPEVVCTAEEVAEHPLVIDGRVAGRAVRLRGDVRHRDEHSLVVWAAGPVLPARRKPRRGRVARFVAGRRLHAEIAIEFVR
ncbi:hypothetical protein [Amycolatopsis sp. MEPSY49]|uniref:hypothetical protein n=1 Tax=Amycolatopsis sp. MEPSY49 TaxID=3151600 RepID=UPI003EF32E1C